MLRWLFFAAFVRPLVFLFLGLKVRGYEHLPIQGPALVVANHNSHLDTVVLMSIFPLSSLPDLRAAAAADYWASGGFKAWFASKIIGIVPVVRKRDGAKLSAQEVLEPIDSALKAGRIVIFFPEGTRGEPERLQDFKVGLGILAKENPLVPVLPVYLYGLGKALPRGEALLVPQFVDAFVGAPALFTGEVGPFVRHVQTTIEEMREGAGRDEVWE